MEPVLYFCIVNRFQSFFFVSLRPYYYYVMKVKYLLLSALAMTLVSCSKTETSYYPDGHTQSKIHYRFGKETGKSIYYYDVPNTVEIEVEMKNGKRNGEFHRYFENGLLDTYCIYKNDSIEGLAVNYTPNGEKMQEFTYIHGVKNGPHKAYHLSGETKIIGAFKNDKFDGDWTYFDERGVLVGEGTFKEGTGDVTFFDQRGLPSRKTHYKDNKKDGPEEYYTTSGSIYKTIVFKQDRIVSTEVDSSLLR